MRSSEMTLQSTLAAFLLALTAACSYGGTQSKLTRSAPPAHASDLDLVRHIVTKTYSAPTRHAVVVGNFALVEWVHPPSLGNAVGNAALEKRHGRWYVLAAGGAQYQERSLTDFGVPASTARQLIQRLSTKR